MSNPYFKFKQFSVYQDRCAMKVGTDGVLLGAWTNVSTAQQILDIGTGTGLVALMLAQRCNAQITALEVDASAAGQAAENVCQSPWKDRIEVVCKDFNAYRPEAKYDVIVSNPPFFVGSLVSPDALRTQARHTHALSYEQLLQGVSSLLSKEGEFTVIIPYDVAAEVKMLAATHKLYPFKQLNIITSPGKQPKRCLLTFSFSSEECELTELLLERERHCYSDEYIALTKDYYLNL